LDRIYQVLAEWLKKALCLRQDFECLVCVLQQATRHWNMALFTQPCRQTVMVTSDASR
uniref:Uncharacterized protein n=1 Tax=Amphimedon queenslandica TaxID=400682 RepID=A0A1X7U5Z8_AMPQE